MKLKKTILAHMDRDILKAVIDHLEIEGIDRRSTYSMQGKISRSRRASPEMLFGYLNERQAKAVCEEMGIDPKGRRMALVERLQASTKKEKTSLKKKKASAEPVRPATQRKNKRKKALTSMSKKKSTPNAVEQEQAPVRLPDPPAGMMRVTRTELVWPGKYNEDGTLKEVPRVSLPFQVIETVNESRATREALKGGIQRGLFDIYEGKEGDSFEEGWKNKLIWGDNLLVMGSLLEKFAGKIDLIYIDPPFATGADFSFTSPVGDSGEEIFKEQSLIEEKAYRDTWGQGAASYLQMMIQRLQLMRDLLSQSGSIFVHCDWHVSHLLRLSLEEVFGQDHFINEIIWKRKGGSANPQNRLGVVTDTILWCASSPSITVNSLFSKDDPDTQRYIEERFTNVDDSGRRFMKSPIVSPNPRPNLTYDYKGYRPPKNGWSISRDLMEKWDVEGRLYFPPLGKGERIYRKVG